MILLISFSPGSCSWQYGKKKRKKIETSHHLRSRRCFLVPETQVNSLLFTWNYFCSATVFISSTTTNSRLISQTPFHQKPLSAWNFNTQSMHYIVPPNLKINSCAVLALHWRSFNQARPDSFCWTVWNGAGVTLHPHHPQRLPNSIFTVSRGSRFEGKPIQENYLHFSPPKRWWMDIDCHIPSPAQATPTATLRPLPALSSLSLSEAFHS